MQTLAQTWLQEGRQEGLQKGRQEGIQEGLQKGIQKGSLEAKRDDARRMLLDGLSIEKVMKYTGLTEKEIRSLMQ